MDRYLRAYRDAKSPLTPLTPRCNAFNFDFGGDNSLADTLKNTLNEVVNILSPAFVPPTANVNPKEEEEDDEDESSRAQHSSRPQRFSAGFSRLRDIFEKSRNLGLVDHMMRSHGGVATPKPACRIPAQKRKCNTKTIKTEKVDKSSDKVDFSSMASKFLSVADCLLQPPTSPLLRGGKKIKSEFRQASPVAAQPLSPRIAALLEKSGMSRYAALFRREEIDMEVFRLLTERELKMLGIYDSDDLGQLRAAITMAFERF